MSKKKGKTRDTLLLFNFLKHLISLIMSYVSSTTISVLFNDSGLDPFQPSWGIKQGGPPLPLSFHIIYGSVECFHCGKMRRMGSG